MIILNTLLVCEPHILTTEEYNGLSEYLVEKCLFTYKLDPLNVHITSDVDIANYEKPHIHKCVTMESRSACYNLIQTICK